MKKILSLALIFMGLTTLSQAQFRYVPVNYAPFKGDVSLSLGGGLSMGSRGTLLQKSIYGMGGSDTQPELTLSDQNSWSAQFRMDMEHVGSDHFTYGPLAELRLSGSNYTAKPTDATATSFLESVRCKATEFDLSIGYQVGVYPIEQLAIHAGLGLNMNALFGQKYFRTMKGIAGETGETEVKNNDKFPQFGFGLEINASAYYFITENFFAGIQFAYGLKPFFGSSSDDFSTDKVTIYTPSYSSTAPQVDYSVTDPVGSRITLLACIGYKIFGN